MIWPAAIYVGKVLRRMPSELLIPELARVIEENHCDQTWLQWICSEIISSLKREELAALKVPLMEFIYDVKSEHGVSAAKVLELQFSLSGNPSFHRISYSAPSIR